MHKRTASLALVAALGIGGVSSLALSPSIASAASGTLAAATRSGPFSDVLKKLVTDKTLTQDQADKVAAALEAARPREDHDGPGGRHGGRLHLAEIAAVLGVPVADLRTALQGGSSLAEFAATKNISRADLIARLVTAAEKRLAAKVTAGDLTQAQADARKANLKTRITDLVDRKGLPMRGDRPDRDRSGAASSGTSSSSDPDRAGTPSTA